MIPKSETLQKLILKPDRRVGKVLPMKGLEISEGSIKFTAKTDKRHINPLDGVYGEFAATALDSVTGCATAACLIYR